MSSDGWCTGAITIIPMLTWAQVQGAPNVYSVELRRVEEVTDTEHGRTTLVTADAIVPNGESEYSSGSLIRDLQVLVSRFSGHAFGGYIQCDYDSGVAGPDEPNRERFIVVDGRVETVTPRLVWPGDKAAPDDLLADARALALLCRDVLEQMPVGMDEFIGLEESQLPGWFIGYDNDRELSDLAAEGES